MYLYDNVPAYWCIAKCSKICKLFVTPLAHKYQSWCGCKSTRTIWTYLCLCTFLCSNLYCCFCFPIASAMIWWAGDMCKTPRLDESSIPLGPKLLTVITDHLVRDSISRKVCLGVLYQCSTWGIWEVIKFPEIKVMFVVEGKQILCYNLPGSTGYLCGHHGLFLLLWQKMVESFTLTRHISYFSF